MIPVTCFLLSLQTTATGYPARLDRQKHRGEVNLLFLGLAHLPSSAQNTHPKYWEREGAHTTISLCWATPSPGPDSPSTGLVVPPSQTERLPVPFKIKPYQKPRENASEGQVCYTSARGSTGSMSASYGHSGNRCTDVRT